MFFIFSVLCFPNDYHMVKEEKWNINYLKSINYNKVNDTFFHSVSKVVLLDKDVDLRTSHEFFNTERIV